MQHFEKELKVCRLWTSGDEITQEKLDLPASLTPHHQALAGSVLIASSSIYMHALHQKHTLRAATSQEGQSLTCPL